MKRKSLKLHGKQALVTTKKKRGERIQCVAKVFVAEKCNDYVISIFI